MARRQGRWARRASLEALLRFGPEISGLTELQRAAESQFTGAVRGARASARGTIRAVRAARPDVKDIYHDAAAATQNVSDIIGDTSGLPASAQAAIAQEQAGYGNRLREERADALTDLHSRAVGAREGQGAAIRAARDEFASSLQQILRRRLDLAGEQGAYTALRTGELQDAAQARADKFALEQMGNTQSERNSLRSAGIDPDTGRPLPGKGKGGKGNRATTAQIAAAQDSAQLATSEIRTLKKLGATRGEIAELLKSGAEDQQIPLHDPKTGKPLYNPDGTPKVKHIGGVPQIKSQTLLSAALDQAFKGYVSPAVWRRLAKRGLRPADLGFITYRQWQRRAQTPGGAVDAAGQIPVLGTILGG